MKKIAVINDLSGFGKCSLTAALPIISAFGIQACPLPTGVFSNQTGYESFKSVDLTDSMKDFIAEWKRLEAAFDGILTGFIPNSRQGKIISDFIDGFKADNTVVAVDPIMGDDGELYPCHDEKTVAAVTALVKKADVITPNITELALLCGMPLNKIYSPEEIKAMSEKTGVKTVITTGLDFDNEIGNAVYSEGEFRIIKSRKHGEHFSGTGDIFTAYVLSDYLINKDIFSAVKNASAFIEKAIEETLKNEPEKHYHPDGIEFEKFIKTI